MYRVLAVLTSCLLVVACAEPGPVEVGLDDLPRAQARSARPPSAALYDVGFTTFNIVDPDRDDRLIPLYVWYPADPRAVDSSTPEAQYPLDPFHPGDVPLAASSSFEAHGLGHAYHEPMPASGPFPLVMFSPGWQATAYGSGLTVGTGLAQHGFVVVSMTHWGDAASFHPDEPLEHLALAIRNRPLDVSRALDAMMRRNGEADNLLYGMMDANRVVASGWSIGGYTAMALVGGDDEVCDLADVLPGWPVPPEACGSTQPDPRITAILPLDGSNQLLTFQELSRVQVPVLAMGQEWSSAGDWQARQHAAFSGHPSYRLDLWGTNHMSFSDICPSFAVMAEYGVIPAALAGDLIGNFCPSDLLDPAEARRLIVKYMLAFLNGDQRILTPGHALTAEPDIEFFVTEKRSFHSIWDEWPGEYTYFMHQPGKAHARAFKDLTVEGVADPTGARPLDFAAIYGVTGRH